MFSKATLSAIFFALATAAPLAKRDTCSPNFQGSNVQIVSQSSLYLNLPSPPSSGDIVTLDANNFWPFRFEQTGQADGGYVFKVGNVPDNSLGDITWNANLVVAPLSQLTDTFDIHCTWCQEPGTPYTNGQSLGTYCSIVDRTTGQALQADNNDLWVSTLTPDSSFYFDLFASTS